MNRMSKELEALEPSVLLEFIDGLLKRYENKTDYNIYITKDWLLEIKKAIKRLESIDNSNPSEALKCLERIDNTLCLNNIKGKLEFGIDTEEHTDCDSVIGMTEDLEAIKQALLKAQEQEKVLNEVLKLNGERAEKLDYYQDLEKQLGCPLEVVFKALVSGVYCEDVANRMKYMAVVLYQNLDGEYVLYFTDEEWVLTKNYKKTWWLKKDKTE